MLPICLFDWLFYFDFLELHFKLATRKSSGSSLNRTLSRQNSQTVLEKIQTLSHHQPKNVSDKGFEKALNQTVNEGDLDNRLEKIKSTYDQNRYDDLLTRLKDAEGKNEYLSKIIGRLQSNKPHGHSKLKSNSQDTFSDNIKLIDVNLTSPHQHVSNSNLAKINLNNIYTIEPLRIKLNENDDPRPPTLEETEVFILKLYNLYKHQKQQVTY